LKNGGTTFPSILYQKCSIYGTLISYSIYHITLDRESKGSSSGGPHTTPTRGSLTIEGQLRYRKK
jgi:hypothetical protein